MIFQSEPNSESRLHGGRGSAGFVVKFRLYGQSDLEADRRLQRPNRGELQAAIRITNLIRPPSASPRREPRGSKAVYNSYSLLQELESTPCWR